MSDHRLDMLIAELTRPHDPMAITAEFVPERIILAGLGKYRIMPGLPPGAEVIDTAPFVDMPETHIDPPIAALDPLANDAEYAQWDDIQECWMEDDNWGCDLRERTLNELKGART